MDNNNNEYQDVTERYRNLSSNDRIVFKLILELAVVLFKSIQDQKGA